MNLGDQAAEDSMEALVSFNEDMKVLACNAYQMQEMLDSALEENDVILDWMRKLEESTTKTESGVLKIATKIE